MDRAQVTTDEEAKQFFREWAMEPGRFKDSHLQSEGFRAALRNYELARLGLKKDVAGALQYALNLAGGTQ